MKANKPESISSVFRRRKCTACSK